MNPQSRSEAGERPAEHELGIGAANVHDDDPRAAAVREFQHRLIGVERGERPRGRGKPQRPGSGFLAGILPNDQPVAHRLPRPGSLNPAFALQFPEGRHATSSSRAA